ncbi:MAG: alanine racemase [Clostridia bacterium]
MHYLRRCWAEINLDNVLYNYNLYRDKIKNEQSRIIAVVKANAYGHGANQVAKLLQDNGCDYFAVSNATEAINLRKSGICGNIMLLGFTPLDSISELIKYNIIVTITSTAYALALNDLAIRLNKVIPAYVKLDSGMGRIGFICGEKNTVDEIYAISKLSNLTLQGAFTHLCVADSQKDEDKLYTRNQISAFEQTIDKLKELEVPLPLLHCCNSAGGHYLSTKHKSAIRLGISLYGLTFSDGDIEGLPLRPAMTLKTAISNIKTIHSGQSVSYGRRFIASKDTVVATVTMGYADGYSRQLTNKGQMYLNGKLVNVIGTVTMDQVMLDITGVNASIGDEVTVFGGQGLTCTQLANSINTINYEITCNISARVPRIYIKDNKIIEVVDHTY